MPPAARRVNRGPSAAPQNRAAILDAARRLFADRGFLVPLSAIATEAGVGQGVLYRHFPTRLDLAFAVFEDNFVELEAAAAGGGPDAFGALWAVLLEQTVREAAFVEMVVEARSSAPAYDGDDRLRELIARTLPDAVSAGRVPAGVEVDDVLLAWRMVFGIVVTAPTPDAARAHVARAMALLDPRR
ncbi:TetR/AcrR family transcriptional regulator [Cellulomonas sp. ICMP 17802]|uniref:TetR/AcrR family transcriptional regulator n=1 Tax=Cellulomonas sp. ICMP 17802 TaxID=3239199 RepID=UPI00351B99F7